MMKLYRNINNIVNKKIEEGEKIHHEKSFMD